MIDDIYVDHEWRKRGRHLLSSRIDGTNDRKIEGGREEGRETPLVSSSHVEVRETTPLVKK